MSTKTAIVTGAAGGIGSAVTHALSSDGWTVVLAGRRREALERVAQESADMPGHTIAKPTDVTDERSVQHLLDYTANRFDRVDLLFNNAGVFDTAKQFDDISLSEWNAIIAVNLTGAFLCAREAFKVMRNQKPQGGRIINNGSLSSLAPRPMAAAYTATKHAITGLTKSLSLEGRSHNIACGQIDIGNAATQMTDRLTEGVLQANMEIRTEPRMNAQDVAHAVLYMASLPLEANVANMTLMATTMPFIGRG